MELRISILSCLPDVEDWSPDESSADCAGGLADDHFLSSLNCGLSSHPHYEQHSSPGPDTPKLANPVPANSFR